MGPGRSDVSWRGLIGIVTLSYGYFDVKLFCFRYI